MSILRPALGHLAILNLEPVAGMGQAGNHLSQAIQPYLRLFHPLARSVLAEVGQDRWQLNALA